MTFRIEKVDGSGLTILRLIGRLQSDSLDELKQQIETSGQPVVLDLAEVDLIAVEVVRFLGDCRDEKAAIANAPAFIREWIACESRKTNQV